MTAKTTAMAVKPTKGRKAAKQKAPPKKTPKPQLAALVVLRSADVEVDAIDPNPFQPRVEFPEAEIAALAASLTNQGQWTAITLRESEDSSGRPFQCLDGERRVRAARVAGLKTLRAEIVTASDAQARAIVLATVLHRQDLTCIERARAFKAALDAGDAAGPTELAGELGIDQSTVSNQLRLLDLPEFWQERLISREITERHARAVLRWLDYPAVMEDLERTVVSFRTGEGAEICSVAQWENEAVPNVVRNNSRSLDGVHGDRCYYDSKLGKLTIFEPNALQIKPLEIIELDGEQRAMNTKLFDKLQAEHVEQILKVREEAEEAEAKSCDDDQDTEDVDPADDQSDEDLTAEDGDSAGLWDRPQAEALTAKLLDVYDLHREGKIKLDRPAIALCDEIKRIGYLGLLDTPTRDKALDIVEKFWKAPAPGATVAKSESPDSSPLPASEAPENAVRRWLLAWAQWLIADEIRTGCDAASLMSFLLLAMHVWKLEPGEQELDEACADKLEPNRKQSLSQRLLSAAIYHVEQVAGTIVADWFFQADRGPMFLLTGEEVKRIVEAMGIELENEFSAGNVMTERALLNFFDAATLADWATKWEITIPPKTKREKVIDLLAEAMREGRPMPAELKTAWKAIGKKS